MHENCPEPLLNRCWLLAALLARWLLMWHEMSMIDNLV